MRLQPLIIAGILAIACSACGAEEKSQDAATATQMDHTGHMAQKAKPKKDMKAMFGDDYKRGDIGHSFGEIVSIAPDKRYATIDHGEIHGIDMGPMTMGFDALESADLSRLVKGDKVEFLVKKGEDGTYRLFSICGLGEGQKKCLKG